MKSFGLLPRIIVAIIVGIIAGTFAPDAFIRILATFNGLFGNFLGFVIPLIIIGFIAPGIGSIGKGAGKLLGMTTLIAYCSTIIAGLVAFFTAKAIYPSILSNQAAKAFENPEKALLEPFFSVEMTPIMGVMSALLLAFALGLGMAAIKGDTLQKAMDEFRQIIEIIIEKIIIPLLPIHILGIFANMTQGGQVSAIMSVFAKVFIMIIILHILYLCVQYTAAGTIRKQSPLRMLKTMLPAYFTALGTQSSASTIPVTLEKTKQMGVKGRIADFSVPLLATIHLSGSTITLVSCSMAVMLLQGEAYSFASMLPFILMLGVTMIAAPGVPGGAVMAALGLLETMLGFDATMVSLMIALYLAQDSFGTACNVTGDGALTAIVDKLNKE
ncbi:dicarboxylate/amino acid:cation symporter [Pseudobacillus badius]|uniref:dicarboxylate/amino acid:cation symporter n=1 Tax=Bacillus badius TaxID=1455 RepID=UPI0007B0C000|nr:dicarboxylate/amino acid:cation symporter [Bacillus badius]KZO00404.1 sodium:proton antiporter [Bacillus badius]OCS86630.1 sodium:proton antiporter [Bacillus badius]OVE51644.1 sodium:proton antiporter [Bacillus badius]TDW02889.1 Na+/H+-dicarboxylate symporter [Bacillus badius]UAT31030.1 dicarboxylate/amino acid:cation symporter [Bacillus badius]